MGLKPNGGTEFPAVGVSRPPSARRRAVRTLQPAKLVDGDVAAHRVAGLDFDQWRLADLADALHESRTTGMENTSTRRIGRTRDLTAEPDAVAGGTIDARHGRQQRL